MRACLGAIVIGVLAWRAQGSRPFPEAGAMDGHQTRAQMSLQMLSRLHAQTPVQRPKRPRLCSHAVNTMMRGFACSCGTRDTRRRAHHVRLLQAASTRLHKPRTPSAACSGGQAADKTASAAALNTPLSGAKAAALHASSMQARSDAQACSAPGADLMLWDCKGARLSWLVTCSELALSGSSGSQSCRVQAASHRAEGWPTCRLARISCASAKGCLFP